MRPLKCYAICLDGESRGKACPLMTAIHCTWAVRQATLHCIHPQKNPMPAAPKYYSGATLNRLGIVVDDLDTVEQKVIKRGYVPNSH